MSSQPRVMEASESVSEPMSFLDALRAGQDRCRGGSGWVGGATADAADHAVRALAALETMSRRMEDLARELNCLGYFDDRDGRPRAA